MGVWKVPLISIVFIISLILCEAAAWTRTRSNHDLCHRRSLVRYQMTVNAQWDKQTFPKMFPTQRPHAQWSKLIGRSHSGHYRMWREGQNASIAVKEFAEKGDADHFDQESSQGYEGMFDAFVAQPIRTSVGQTSTIVTLDGHHSKVSFMMKMVPSPDWFIGLDSVDLCHRGRWRRTFMLDLQPFDAGTDKGMLFTSPNWANDPQEQITLITASLPNHPASSFFYPEYKELPRLANVTFDMISEYRLKKIHKKIKAPLQNTPVKVKFEHNNVRMQEKDNNMQMLMNDNGRNFEGPMKLDTIPSHTSDELHLHQDNLNKTAIITTVTVQPNIGEETNSRVYGHKTEDCQVSEWSPWSLCSKSCGYGTKQRTRQVVVVVTHPMHPGTNCPLLQESSLCGSMRNCKWNHFYMIRRKSKHKKGHKTTFLSLRKQMNRKKMRLTQIKTDFKK